MRPLELAEVEALVEALPDRYRALVLLAVGTGLRQGELLGLAVDDVDFLRREVHVRHQLVSVPAPPTTSARPRPPAAGGQCPRPTSCSRP